MPSIALIVLAAGEGTRMKSGRAKVLHPVAGRPMLVYTLRLCRALEPERTAVVIGHQADEVKEIFGVDFPDVYWVEQTVRRGTGDAVRCAESVFKGYAGDVLILYGDVPLLTQETVGELVAVHRQSAADMTVLTAVVDDPAGYGRVVRNAAGECMKIVEDRDADVDERAIDEINSGIYCVDARFLFESVAGLDNRNDQGEYYLTDIAEMARTRGRRVMTCRARDPHEVMGINTREELDAASGRMKAGRPSTRNLNEG